MGRQQGQVGDQVLVWLRWIKLMSGMWLLWLLFFVVVGGGGGSIGRRPRFGSSSYLNGFGLGSCFRLGRCLLSMKFISFGYLILVVMTMLFLQFYSTNIYP